ncbi:MAG TPA: serine/threonine-protein kinase, partial [Mobilitalea sp.]|nr:serine/threonine-protein kinase [Mobilitalea sp.]
RMQQQNWFGKYRILGLLGKGGSAEVYLAEHIKLNSFRAIKFISKNHPLYQLQCKEASILKNLKHSCIPIIYDIEEDEDGSYIVEQYLEGETLKRYVQTKGTICEDSIIRYGLQLCDLMRYLHSLERPVQYVDLKPENLILSDKTLKLIDFGSAVYLDELSESQGYCGTRGFAAPELYTGSKINERCDVYGIGMLMYYMATGKDVKNISELDHIDQVARCSKKFKKIINKCVKFNPSQRFTSITGLSRELSAMIRNRQVLSESSQTVKIAVAGAQPRIGVTHLSLRLCKYLISRGHQCLYQEENESECVWCIKDCYEDVMIKNGIHVIEEIPMLADKVSYKPDLESFQYRIQDFGCLTGRNLEQFLEAKVKLLVLGAKDWEIKYAERVIQMTAEYKDIIYLFNYMDGRQFQKIINSMEQKRCDRIPYEPNPFAKINPGNELDFFRNLIEPRKGRMRRRLLKEDS